MYLEGRRILGSNTLLRRRRKTLHDSFDIDMRDILEGDEMSNEELAEKLTARHTLEPLEILPTDFVGQGFQIVHDGVPGLTETFFGFGRDVPYTGDGSLWNYSSISGNLTDLRMKFSLRGEASLKGICTEAECATIDAYLESKVDYIRKHVMPVTRVLVENHNRQVATAAERHVQIRARLIDQIRKEIA